MVSSLNVNAGVWNTTAHSRANCASINESITWNGHKSFTWEVVSVHWYKTGTRNETSHSIDTGMNYTWRAAAMHIGEAARDPTTDWRVQGYHFYLNNNGIKIYDVYTEAVDCNIYDGWWGEPEAH